MKKNAYHKGNSDPYLLKKVRHLAPGTRRVIYRGWYFDKEANHYKHINYRKMPKYLKKIASRKVRHQKEIFTSKNNYYKKFYDVDWNLL